jgi:hypothetical protein
VECFVISGARVVLAQKIASFWWTSPVRTPFPKYIPPMGGALLRDVESLILTSLELQPVKKVKLRTRMKRNPPFMVRSEGFISTDFMSLLITFSFRCLIFFFENLLYLKSRPWIKDFQHEIKFVGFHQMDIERV